MAKSNEAQLIMRFEAKTRDFERSLKRVEKKLYGSTNNMERKWGSSMSRMERRAGKFARSVGKGIGLGAVAGVAGLTALIKVSLQAADDLQHLSQQIGVGASTLQEYTFIADRMGVSQAALNKAFKTGTTNIGEYAATGGGEAAEALETLGIAHDVAAGKITNIGQILPLIIRHLEGEENALKRVGFAAELFGKKGGVQLAEILGLGADGIKELADEAHKLGIIMDNDAVKSASDANDMLAKLAGTIKGNLTRAVVELSPEIEAMASSLIDSLPGLVTWFEAGISKLKDFGAAWNASPFGAKTRQSKPNNIVDAEKQIAELEKIRAYVDEYNKAGFLTKDRYLDPKINKAAINIFGGESWKRILKGSTDYHAKEIIDAYISGRQRIITALEDEALSPVATKTPKRAKGRASPADSGIKVTKETVAQLQQVMRENTEIMAEELARANDLYSQALTPIDNYYARLAELAAVENGVFAADVGAEAFASLKVKALVELAQATGDVSLAFSELDKIVASGGITKAGADAVINQVNDALGITAQRIQQQNELEQQAAFLRERKIRQSILLADLAGNGAEVESLERQLALLRKIDELTRGGGESDDEAEKTANKELDDEEAAKLRGKIKRETKAAFRAAIDGEFGDHLKDKLSEAADSMFDSAVEALLNTLMKISINSGGQGGGSSGVGWGIFFDAVKSAFGGQGGGPSGAGNFSNTAKSISGNYNKGTAAKLGYTPVSQNSSVVQNLYFDIKGVDTPAAFKYAEQQAAKSYTRAMSDTDRRAGNRRRGLTA